jgi:5-methylcytosine-specific restriction endonuclease McrA
MTSAYRTSTVDGCEGKFLAKGMCGKHYQRVKMHGSTDPRSSKRPINHGTPWGYDRDGCRCNPCREATRSRKARYRSEHKEQSKIASAQHEANNREKRTKQLAARRAANPRYAQATREWAQNNPEKVHLAKLRRRAAEVNADNRRITPTDWLRLCIRFDHCCAYCGAAKPLTRDHVIPLSRGGRNAIGNILPACGSCNYSKGAKLLIEWRARRMQ